MTILFDFAVDKAQLGNAWGRVIPLFRNACDIDCRCGWHHTDHFSATPLGEWANCIVERRVLTSIALHRSM
jgi:hypothetical protein